MTPDTIARLEQDVEMLRFVTEAVHYYGSDKDQLADDIEAALAENVSLRELLGAAIQDTERLDWLEKHPLKAGVVGGSDDGGTGTFWGCGSANLNLRETIDTISALKT